MSPTPNTPGAVVTPGGKIIDHRQTEPKTPERKAPWAKGARVGQIMEMMWKDMISHLAGIGVTLVGLNQQIQALAAKTPTVKGEGYGTATEVFSWKVAEVPSTLYGGQRDPVVDAAMFLMDVTQRVDTIQATGMLAQLTFHRATGKLTLYARAKL